MDYEELRPLTIEALRNLKDQELQLVLILNETEKVTRSKGFYANVKPTQYFGRPERYMPAEDREKVRQIVWEFILQGILTIGLDELNPDFPFVQLTEHGKKVIESGHTLPYDPDGYLEALKRDIPAIDQLIELYLSESLQAYLKGLLFSSAVTLGVASEKAFLLLFDSFTNALTDPTKKKKFQRLQNSIRTRNKFDALKNEILIIRKRLPNDLAEDLESQFEGIFNLIRVTRNDAGHPSGKIINRGVAYTNLQLFPMYCRRVYALIDYFNNNPI